MRAWAVGILEASASVWSKQSRAFGASGIAALNRIAIYLSTVRSSWGVGTHIPLLLSSTFVKFPSELFHPLRLPMPRGWDVFLSKSGV